MQEKIQFAMGLVVRTRGEDGSSLDDEGGATSRSARAAAHLVVSWGVADCTGATREVEIAVVAALLAQRISPSTL